VNKDLIKFITKVVIYFAAIFGMIITINYNVDASFIFTADSHEDMAKLALEGNIVVCPLNYNERIYQICIVRNMKSMPDTIVIGSSRGMHLGEEITGYSNMYNNCVSGACIEDYYGLLGLYYEKYGNLPRRIIVETSPWVLFEYNPESRWTTNKEYYNYCYDFYNTVNGVNLIMNSNLNTENPYISLSYFQYNIKQFKEKGMNVFDVEARISKDVSELADNPDGSIRYSADEENESEHRLSRVQNMSGAVSYQNIQDMTELGETKVKDYEKLIDYLLNNGCEVIIYMAPFSETQCGYSIDQGFNASFELVEQYLRELANEKGIQIVGGFDSRKFGLTDKRFIDYMHVDQKGTSIVWNY